jgi:hypothetical protein
MPCLWEKPLIVYNLSYTCFGPLWAIYQQASNNDDDKCERYNTAYINKQPMHLQM